VSPAARPASSTTCWLAPTRVEATPSTSATGSSTSPPTSIDGARSSTLAGRSVPGASIGFGLLEIVDGDDRLRRAPGRLDRRRDRRGAGGQPSAGALQHHPPGPTVRRTSASATGSSSTSPSSTTWPRATRCARRPRAGRRLRLADEDATADDHERVRDTARRRVCRARHDRRRRGGDPRVRGDRVRWPSRARRRRPEGDQGGARRPGRSAPVPWPAGLVCLETVGLGCAAAVLLLVPRGQVRT
jgi:hypothetical protein